MTYANIKQTQNGFTLVEMAIVLALIGLILGTGLTLMTAQQDQRRIEETKDRLDEAREALIGYAIANGRLPCPATNASNGEEAPLGGGGSVGCTGALNGFLPAVTLGLSNVDDQGYLQDAWRIVPNRIRYAVTTANTNTATTLNGIQTTTMTAFAPDLFICDTTTGTVAAANCGTATKLTGEAVAVIYSLGANAANGSAGTDEAENTDADRVFVRHSLTLSKDNPANGEFDDQLTWLSKYTLFNRMRPAINLALVTSGTSAISLSVSFGLVLDTLTSR